MFQNHGLGETCGRTPELTCEEQAASYFDKYLFGDASAHILMSQTEFAAYYHFDYSGSIPIDDLYRWCDEDRDGNLTVYEFKHCYCHEEEYQYVEPIIPVD